MSSMDRIGSAGLRENQLIVLTKKGSDSCLSFFVVQL